MSISMNCPGCQQPLSLLNTKTSDEQDAIVHECFNCGGHFLPPLVANLLDLNTAENLDSITPKNIFPQVSSILCPICNQSMTNITDDVVPKGVTIYTCQEGHGNYFPIHQLLAFKKAQKAKLDYHQIWGIPIKSVFAILLPTIVILTVAAALPLAIGEMKSNQDNRTRASGILLAPPTITPVSPNQVVIAFTTQEPQTSTITIQYQNKSENIIVSNTPQTTHVITLNNLTPGYRYTFSLTVGNSTTQQFNLLIPTP